MRDVAAARNPEGMARGESDAHNADRGARYDL